PDAPPSIPPFPQPRPPRSVGPRASNERVCNLVRMPVQRPVRNFSLRRANRRPVGVSRRPLFEPAPERAIEHSGRPLRGGRRQVTWVTSNPRWCRRYGLFRLLFDRRCQRFDCGGFEDLPDRDTAAELAIESRDHLRGEERLAADGEEVITDADRSHVQHVTPDLCE